MNDADLARLGDEVRKLNPDVAEHWNAQGTPNCNFLSGAVGIQVTNSMLVTNGLMRERTPMPLVPPVPPTGAAVPPQGAADPEPRAMPELDTFNDQVSFHRNKRAIAELGELMGRADAIIGGFARKSGDIEAGHRHIKIVAKECARLLRAIDVRSA